MKEGPEIFRRIKGHFVVAGTLICVASVLFTPVSLL